jgi:hypothetical protein
MSRKLAEAMPIKRFVQFRLRALLVVLTLACVASAVYGWQKRRSHTLESLVTNFNAKMDEQRYTEAGLIAAEAYGRFPDNPVCILMVEKSLLAQRIMRGEPVEATCELVDP